MLTWYGQSRKSDKDARGKVIFPVPYIKKAKIICPPYSKTAMTAIEVK